jgi:hypothetical protein
VLLGTESDDLVSDSSSAASPSSSDDDGGGDGDSAPARILRQIALAKVSASRMHRRAAAQLAAGQQQAAAAGGWLPQRTASALVYRRLLADPGLTPRRRAQIEALRDRPVRGAMAGGVAEMLGGGGGGGELSGEEGRWELAQARAEREIMAALAEQDQQQAAAAAAAMAGAPSAASSSSAHRYYHQPSLLPAAAAAAGGGVPAIDQEQELEDVRAQIAAIKAEIVG